MASKITVTTLRQGAAMLGLDVGDLKKKKELEKLIDEHLQQQELGYECPECGKDIPDVDVCPYCGESFVEEEEVEELESAGEVEVDEAEEEEVVEAEDGVVEEAAEEEVENVDEIAEEVAEAVTKKVENEEKSKSKGKGKGKGQEKSGRGRPTGKSKNTEEKEKEFAELVAQIDEVLGDGFEKRERKTGITYVRDRKRLLKVVSTGKSLSIEFNVELQAEDENLKKYTEEEAKARHLGSVRAIYTLGSTEFAIELVKEALGK